jgi:hypothetical protein
LGSTADRRRPGVEPGDQEGIAAGGPDHRHDPFDHLRIGDRPFIGLQRAHRRADHCLQLRDPQALDQSLLDVDEVAHADDGKLMP